MLFQSSNVMCERERELVALPNRFEDTLIVYLLINVVTKWLVYSYDWKCWWMGTDGVLS